MINRHRKTFILAGKAVLALLLLGWVISQVHWHDYVLDRNGKSHAVVSARPTAAAPRELTIQKGILWWQKQEVVAAEGFQPTSDSGEIVRMGFASIIRNIRPWPLAGAAAIYFIVLLVLTFRWRLLLTVAEIRIPFTEALRLTFLGQFFNTVTPGTVGGDLVKAYYVAKHTPNKAAALMSVVFDRVLGLTELTLLAAAMLTVVKLGGLVPDAELRLPAAMVAVVLAILVVAFTFLFSGNLRRLLHLEKIYNRLPIAHHIQAAGRVTVLFRRNIGAMIAAVLVTVIGHVAWIGSIILLGNSLSLPIPWFSYFLYIPLIYIIGAVPITPGGVGLVEKFYQVFFVVGACTTTKILALALLVRLLPILWSLPGGVVAVTGPRLPKAADMEAELEAAEAEQDPEQA